MLAPGPRIWKEMRSSEDGCAKGADPPYQAQTTSAPLAWRGSASALELLQVRPVMLRVTQEQDKPLARTEPLLLEEGPQELVSSSRAQPGQV